MTKATYKRKHLILVLEFQRVVGPMTTMLGYMTASRRGLANWEWLEF